MAEINVPEISTGKAVDILSNTYIAAIKKGYEYKDIRPVIMWGPTGVGKSQSIFQIAGRIEKETGKQVQVKDIRLSNCALTDLIGIPVADKDREKTVWLKPEIFDYDETDKDKIIILFFDELDKAAAAVQAAALQLILDRVSWTHKLPDNAFIIAAANPARDTATFSTRMKPELLNRFRHFNIQPEFDSFREWGMHNQLHPYVLGYLSYDNTKLYAEKENTNTAFPTPRSWKSVSDMLKLHSERSIDELSVDISSDIGTGTAIEFQAWCMVYKELPDTKKIFEGTETNYPKDPDVLHALVSSMSVYVAEHTDTLLDMELSNACRYAMRFPVDFGTLFYRNIMEIDGITLRLMKIPEFAKWVEKHKIKV